MAARFHRGQRWLSEGEPELGLGEVVASSLHTVSLHFAACGETREYSREAAPLRRVRFLAGDTLRNRTGVSLTVTAVQERDGLLYYQGADQEWNETELSPTLSFSTPSERFFAGQFDPPELFNLRLEALKQQYRRRKSPVRGFLGGRIDLLPHQLTIAAEVAGRLVPRVLLADEVGLGKTIEACLILQRLLLTGRVKRVLILVPDSLVHQWFIELLRRFNLWFNIFDEARCLALEAESPGANPFSDDQLLLCSLELFTREERRVEQARAAGWDLLVVDEAHHLGWSKASVSREYAAVEALSRVTPGLILLTATPEQLGMASHFARLRLLDPDRFPELEAFLQEAEGYREVAHLAEQLQSGLPLTSPQVGKLAQILKESPASLEKKLTGIGQGENPKPLIEALLDQHGTGRVMFRTTRATIAGFPLRAAHLYPLKAPEAERIRQEALAREFAADSDPSTPFQPHFGKDPRIEWLAHFLNSLPQEKVLVICHTRAKAEAIETALRPRLNLRAALFHEGLTLVQRDRGAAWFADPRGARLLICSEIGSEGRNFQFAHHLVLFDLPLDPALVEQRIGRLDRIGQTAAIQIHVPFEVGSAQEVLARWYQEGLNAFSENLNGGRELLEQFGSRVRALAMEFHRDEATPATELEALLEATRAARTRLSDSLEQGRDRLLELNSFRPEVAARLVQEITRQDENRGLDEFMMAMFEHFFIEVEELAPRTYQLGSAGVLVDAFPGLTSDGLTITCDRQRALAREDFQFLTWDHPLVSGALDLFLGSEQGNSSFALWPDAAATGLYLEAVFLLECVAPPHLHVDRFLPATPVRILLDHRGVEAGPAFPPQKLAPLLTRGDAHALLERPELADVLLPRLLEKTQAAAEQKVQGIIAKARAEMTAQLALEIARLKALQRVNRSVRNEEIEGLISQQQALDGHLTEARLRLDSLRLIHRGRATRGPKA